MLTLPLSEDLHLFCVLYNVVSENQSVQNSAKGEGVYSRLKAYTFLQFSSEYAILQRTPILFYFPAAMVVVFFSSFLKYFF